MNGGPLSSKVREDLPLTDAQKEVASQFVATRPSTKAQIAFNKAWRTALAYDELAASEIPADKDKAREREQELNKLGNKLVPGTRQAASQSRAEIHRAALRWLQDCGGKEHFNISDFVQHVWSLPAAERVYRNGGKSQKLTDHAIRAILKERLGIAGKRGRKRKSV